MANRRLALALLFLSLALSLLAASELAGPANAVTSNANPPKISSTSDNSVYQSSYQNPGFYAQGRYWVFYEDSGSQCEHQTGCLLYVSSANGASQWSPPTNVGVHVTDNDWSVTTDGANAYYVRYNETSFDHTPNQALLFGKGLLSSSGVISWQTEQVVLGPSPGMTFPNDVIGIDSNGQFWIGYQQDSSGTKAPHIIHSNSTLPPAPLSTSFVANVSDPTVLQTIGFTAAATGGNWGGGSSYSFNWNFGDGSVATGQTATHQYTVAGNYNVTLSTIDGSSPQQSASSFQTIPVGLLPSNNTPPSVNVPTSTSVKVGTAVSFTITPSDTDGDHVTLSSSSLPAGATLNVQTGKFAWNPSPDQANQFWSMTFTATDNASLSIMKQVLVYVSPSWSGDFALSNSVPNGNWHVDIATLALGSQVYAGYWVEGHNLLGRLYDGASWGFEEDISSSSLPDTTSADVNSFIFASGTRVYAVYYDTNTEELTWASRGSLGGWGQNLIGHGEAKSASSLGRYSLPFTATTNRVNATTSWFYVFWYNQTRRAVDEWSGTGQTWYLIPTPTAFYPQSSPAGSTIGSFHYSAPVNGQNNFGIIWTDGTSSPYNLNFGLETVGPTNVPPTDASWNPRVSCTASIVSIEQILGSQSNPQGGATQTGSIFSPGITAPVVNGEPKRWLTPGPTPPNWLSNGPQCNITDADGQVVSTFVEIRGVQRGFVVNEDYSPNLHYDPVNGGGPYPIGTNSSDSTFNIFTPGYGVCTSTNTTGCMHTIHIEIDRDWKAAGYCGTGTVCDVYPLAQGLVSSAVNKTLIDVQGFIYWDPDHAGEAAHSFSGWEIHPVTAWRKSNVAPTIGVSANPSTLTLLPGKSLTSTVVINSTNLFSGQVSLTAIVNPSGPASPSAAISPATVTVQPCNACAFAASTLNVTATQTSSGPYTITITATSGALTAQAKLSVFVGGFSLSATPSTLNIPTNSTAQSIITITSLGGFNGAVNLADTVNGCACGQLTKFNTTQVTLSSNGSAHVAFTITTGSKTGTDIFTITGTSNTSPPFSASTSVSLNIQEFTVSAGQTVLTMYPGSPNSTVIKLSSQNGFAGPVTVKTTSSPAGLTPSLNTTSVTLTSGGTAFVALTVNGTQPGIYSVTVNATSGSITHLITITVKVVDFTLSSSSSLQVDRSSTGTLTINLTSVGGFVGTVSLSNTTSSTSLHDSLNPLNISLTSGGSGSAILTVFSNTATNATVTITATSGPLRHIVTITVNVVDFQLVAGSVAPASINAGSHGNATITATGLNGFNGTVALTFSAPSALTCSLSPASLKLSPSPVTSILSCSSSKAGDYTVTVTGTDGTLSRTTGGILFHIVDFTITPSSPSITLVVGQSTQTSVALSAENGFVGTVGINLVVSPVGPTATSSHTSVKLTSVGNSTVLTIKAGQNTGIFTLNVTGTSGSLTHSAIISLTITQDAPTLTTSLSSSNIVVGNSALDSASLNGATTTAGGTVTYFLFPNGVCNAPSTIVSVVTVSNGVIPNSRPVTFNATGTYSFNATYSGDNNNKGVTSSCEALTVNPITTTTSVACGSSITIGVPTQCTVTVSDVAPGTLPPSGTVTLSTNSTGTFSPASSCTLAGSSSSTSCSVSYIPTGLGSHNITATYLGDNTHTGSSGSRLLSPGQHPTNTVINCTSPVVVNQAATCTATVTDSTPVGATTPTGTITFSETTGVTGSFNATSCILRTATTPTATCSVSFTPSASGSAGASINGGYGGDSTHSSSSGSNSITVNPRSTSTSLVCTTPVVVNQDSTCTATVSDTSSAGTAITPAGTVAFAETGVAGSFTTNTCTLSGSGATASCTSTFRDSTASGTANISGSYTSSNTIHSNSATSTATVITVNSRTTSTAVSCNSSVVVSQTSICTATVIDTSSAGTPLTPTGTVSFSTTAGSITGSPCSLTAGSVTANASCTVNFTSSAPTTANISASYTPSDTSHSTSQTTSPTTVTVNKRTTTTTVSCATVNVGQSSTCTVTVTDVSPGAPSTPSGAVSVTASGGSVTPTTASCSLTSGSCNVIFTPQSSGAVTVNATYIGGDSIHNGSSGTTTITPGLQGTSTVLNCATPIVVNQGSSCTATVTSTATSGSTTPTGTVNFSTSGSLSPASVSCTLSSGSCTLTFTGAAQGTAIVTGNYTGDNAHSTSKNTASIVINLRNSSAILTCTTTSVAVSASDSCTAYVKDKAVGTAIPPSGVVSFELDGSNPGFTNCTLSTLNATTADCSIGYVPAGGTEGPHTIAATYPGDSAHLAAGSNTIAVNVTQRTTGTTINCTPSPVSLGQSTTCTATVSDTSSGTLITPTGSVNLSVAPTGSGSFTGTCSLSQSTLGTATCNVNYTPSTTGSQTITGSYSGDQDHSPGNPSSFNLSVSTQATTTAIGCTPTSIVVNTNASCNAKVKDSQLTPSSTTPTGTVSFALDSSPAAFASCQLIPVNSTSSGCSVVFIPSPGTEGSHNIVSTYTPDSSHGASSGSFTIGVVQRASATSIVCTSPSVSVNSNDPCTATVRDTSLGNPIIPSGGISFYLDGSTTSLGSCSSLTTVNSTSATCAFTFTPLPGSEGSHSIVAKYSGDTDHLQSGSLSFSVAVTTRTTTTSLVCSPSSVSIGQTVNCTATVRDTSAGNPITPGGSVSFSVTPAGSGSFNGACILSQTVLGTSSCNTNYTPSSVAAQTINGVFTGDSDHSTSQGTFSLNVNLQSTLTTVVCALSSVPADSTDSCTTTVRDSPSGSGSTAPSGSVSLTLDSSTSSFATCNLQAINATASNCSINYVPASGTEGSHTISAAYSPDSSHASSSSSITLTVVQRSTTTTISCLTPVVVDQSSQCTATVTDSAGSGATTPSGSVSFTSTGLSGISGSPCSLIAGSKAGIASCSVTFAASSPGTATINAAYTSTDSDHAPSQTAAGSSIIINKRTTATSLSCTSPVVVNQVSTCTVTVQDNSTAGNPVTPSGQASFVTTGAGLINPSSCTLATVSMGTASCTTSFTGSSTGSDTVTGTYSGDQAHGQSSSSPATITVDPRTTSTTLACSSPVVVNQASTCKASVTDTDTGTPIVPSGNVTFLVAGSGSLSSTSCKLSGGSCSITFTGSATGTPTIAASYAGDPAHSPSPTSTAVITVGSRTTITNLSCGFATLGSPSPCTIMVSDNSPGSPISASGSVGLATNSTGTFDSTCILSGTSATATCTVNYTPTSTGPQKITASYAGDATHSGSTGSIIITPGLHSSATSVSCSTPVVVNQPSNCVITVKDTSSGASTPTGSVNIDVSGVTGSLNPGTCQLTRVNATASNCSASFTPSVTGKASITGTYSGDTTHNGSTSTVDTVNVNPRSTNLTVNCATPVLVNVASTCNVVVTDTSPGTNIPSSGTVTFTSTGLGSLSSTNCSLTANSCSVSFTGSSSGSATVTGSYTGDSVHTGSVSQAATIVVNLRTTSTTVTCTSSVVVNQPATCTATVMDNPSNGGTPISPAGSVSLTETGVAVSPTVSSCTLLAGTTGTSSCSASFTPSASGTASITGGYTPSSADTSHQTSPLSTAASVVVSPRLTIITVSCSSQVVVNQASTCSATVTDSPSNQGTAITPVGTIAFIETGIAGSFTGSPCNTMIGATLGTASCPASFTPSAPGTANINATFVPSDQAHSGSSATSAATISSTLRTTTTTVSCTAAVVVNQASTCTATVIDSSSNLGTPINPSGIVTFSSSGTATGTFTNLQCTLVQSTSSSRASSCSTAFTGSASGNANINAGYSSSPTDTAHADSSSTTSSSITVNPRTTTVAVSCVTPVVVGEASTCTATVSDSSSAGLPLTPGGTVSFSETGVSGTFSGSPCTLVPGSTSGTASCSASFTSPSSTGSASVSAVYSSADNIHGGSSTGSNAGIVVTLISTSMILSCSSSATIGSSASCIITVSDVAPGTLPPTGTVKLSSNSTGTFNPATCILPGTATSESCTVSYSPTVGGHHLINATYVGDSSHTSSGPSTALIATTPAPLHNTATAINCAPNPVVVNQASTCSATVTDINPSPTAPTGTVTFSYSGTGGSISPSSCTLVASTASQSVCHFPVNVTPSTFGTTGTSGNGVLTAGYSGDLTHNASPSQAFSLTVNSRQTTTTVTCTSPVLVNEASTCTATISDSSTGGSPVTPTGSVSFSETGVSGSFQSSSCELISASTGTASCSATFTAPAASGSASISAAYTPNDNVHSASQSSTPSTINVAQRTTTTSVQCTSQVVVNQPSTCNAVITDSSTSGTAITPTGTVSFSETGVPGGFTGSPCNLTPAPAPGSASCTASFTASSTSGTATVNATYTPSDTAHIGSISTSSSKILITPRATITTVSCSSPVVVNQPASCTATVTDSPSNSGGPVTPSGTVGFSETGVPDTFTTPQCNLTPSTTVGTATCTDTFLSSAAGTASVSATYTTTNSAHNNSSTTTTSSITVNLRTTSTSLSCATSVVVGQASSCSVIVTENPSSASSSITPSGTVIFTQSGVTATFGGSPCTLQPTGTTGSATCTVTLTASSVGGSTVTATYNGDGSHGGSNANFAVSINTRSTSTHVTCVAPVVIGQASQCKAIVNDTDTGTPMTPSGSVSFASTGSGSLSSQTCNLAGGSCTVSFTGSLSGTATVTGTYVPDAFHSASTSTAASITVGLRSTTTVVTCSSTNVGQESTCMASVADASPGTSSTPIGTVTFTASGGSVTNPTASCPLISGNCSVVFSPQSSLAVTVTAAYKPSSTDTEHGGSQGTATITPGIQSTSTSLVCDESIIVNQNMTCTATVTSTAANGATSPSGEVSFTDAGAGLVSPSSASCVLTAETSSSSTCTVEFKGSASGPVTINATYTGNSAYKGGNGLATVTVNPRATSIAISCMGSIVVNQLTTCKATVNDTSTIGSPSPPLGGVDFPETGLPETFPGSPSTLPVSDATATCTVTFLDSTLPGTATINASYKTSDSIHSDSTTPTATSVSVASRSSTVTVSCQPTATVVGNSTVCVATVTDGSPQPTTTPTGVVKFSNATGVFATCSLTSLGKCSEQYTPTSVISGPQTITVSYSGDSTHETASGKTTITVAQRPPQGAIGLPLVTYSIFGVIGFLAVLGIAIMFRRIQGPKRRGGGGGGHSLF